MLTLALAMMAPLGCLAQGRTVTLVLDNPGYPIITTNEFTIFGYETAELKAYDPYLSPPWVEVEKGGRHFLLRLNDYTRTGYETIFPRHIIAGPAKLMAYSFAGTSYVTFEVRPEGFDPNKTLIVPPGTNRVAVALECSTNLVHWVLATNGVYGGSPDEAKFFRIHAEKTP